MIKSGRIDDGLREADLGLENQRAILGSGSFRYVQQVYGLLATLDRSGLQSTALAIWTREVMRVAASTDPSGLRNALFLASRHDSYDGPLPAEVADTVSQLCDASYLTDLDPNDPDRHVVVTMAMRVCAESLLARGKRARGEALYRELEQLTGEDALRGTPVALEVLLNAALDRARSDDAELALRLLSRGLETAEVAGLSDNPNVLYTRACVHALLGQDSNAIVALRDAIENGLSDEFRLTMGEDADLERLYGLPEFQSLTERAVSTPQ